MEDKHKLSEWDLAVKREVKMCCSQEQREVLYINWR
jgi:hypothetical protein